MFPYVFNPPSHYWGQNTVKLRFIGQRAGGMEKLKGRTIANVYRDDGYGRETIPILDQQAAHCGFTDWIATDQALVRPLVEVSAAKYAQEKGITPRDCP